MRSGVVMLTLLGGMALGGCQLDARITVTAGRQPEFAFGFADGKAACPRGVTVSDGDDGAARTVWAIRRIDARDAAGCADRIRFGVAPPGYEVVVAAAALAPGRHYAVSATGTGWHAATRFVAEA